MTQQIFTLNDAREERLLDEARREHRLAKKEARKKVKHWERKAKQFDGEVHHETLHRMRQRLRELEDEGEMA